MCGKHAIRRFTHGNPLARLEKLIGASVRARLNYYHRVDPITGCWLWVGALSRGYGRITLNGKFMSAHRAAFEEFRGPIGEGLQLDHLCRIRHCINPWHLEPVPCAENIRRGSKPSASHCLRGHPFSGDNLRTDAKGHRHCRACYRIRSGRSA